MEKKKGHIPSYWYPLSLVCLFFLFVREYLFRPFWFDEALTLMNFAWLPGPVKIYFSYVIPNNQIIYTIFLHYWNLLPHGGMRPDFFLRLLSVCFAAGTLILLYQAFKRSCGKVSLYLALAALAVSPPFLIYATALRGYMASCFFVACTLVSGRRFLSAPSGKNWMIFFAGCLLAAGTIPSNLLALGGCVCCLLPGTLKNFWRLKRNYVLALTPVAALVCFYLPVAGNFAGMFKLGEGWNSSLAVLTAFYAAAAAVFGVLLLPGIGSSAFIPPKCRRIFPFFAFLLPVLAVLCLHKPPFPRVCLPLFPVLALVTAQGLKHFFALLKGKRKRLGISRLLIGCVLVWGAAASTDNFKSFFAEKFGNGADDDFFYGYYMRKAHVPEDVVKGLERFYQPGRIPPVYLSFSADPWPVMYYMLSRGYESRFLFDGPRGPVRELERGSLVIINRGERFEPLEKRFSGVLKPLFETAMHKAAVFE